MGSLEGPETRKSSQGLQMHTAILRFVHGCKGSKLRSSEMHSKCFTKGLTPNSLLLDLLIGGLFQQFAFSFRASPFILGESLLQPKAF